MVRGFVICIQLIFQGHCIGEDEMDGIFSTCGRDQKWKQYLLMKSQLKKPCRWHTGVHKSRAVKFCTVATTVCESSVWNLFHVAHLVSRILRWLQDFWKNCVSQLAQERSDWGPKPQEKFEIKRLCVPEFWLDGRVPCSVDSTTAYSTHSPLPVGGS